MASFIKANELYKQGRYQEALEVYTELKSVLGEKLVQFNIDQCLKQINKEAAFDNDFLEKSTQTISSIQKKSEQTHLDAEHNHFLNEFFDNIYVVNLKHHIEKRLRIAKHLKSYNIGYELFEAVNGYEGEPLKIWNSYKQRPIGDFVRFPHMKIVEQKRKTKLIESAGAIGYIFSYVNILRDAKSRGFKKILILEDDILLDRQFDVKIKKFIQIISSDWKVLQLGASQYGWKGIDENSSVKKGYYHPRRIDDCATCGSFAMAINMEIADELIDAVTAFEAPFDHAPLGEIYEKYLGQCFVAYPNIVMPDVSDSSIRGKRDQISHSKRVRWRFDNFDFPLSKPSLGILINSTKNLQYLQSIVDGKQFPFDLKLFIRTVDGFRAVHNLELLTFDYNEITEYPSSFSLDGLDYLITLPKDRIINENDLVDFISHQLGLFNKSPDYIKQIPNHPQRLVKNRASVIIPTFSRPKNLENAILSVANQDYPDIEIIVVSDNGEGSSFNNQNRLIIEKYQNKFKHVTLRLIEHKYNRNGSAARNTGFFASTGEFISFLDDDDVYLPGRLSKVIELLRHQPRNVGAVYCGFLGWNSKINNLERYNEGDLTEDFLNLNFLNHYVHTNTVTYRRESVLKLNGFDESYRRHQDLEFNLRFFENYTIVSLKEPLVRLKPEPTDVSNIPKGIKMLEVKIKFLNQFGYLIKRFPEEVQYSIYQNHIKETLKHVKDEDALTAYYRDNLGDFKTQLLLKFLADSSAQTKQLLRYEELEKRFTNSAIGLYRIIGNNHPLLQNYEQTVENLRLILSKESNFEGIDKIYILNRITNDKLHQQLITTLSEHNAKFIEINYLRKDYEIIGYDFANIPSTNQWFLEKNSWLRLVLNTELRESKNRYLINNNGARNFALQDGKQRRYRWIMPWDGNCFLSDSQAAELQSTFENGGDIQYVLTPMHRVLDNKTISNSSVADNAIEEPQISFRFDAKESFNEERVYGNQPKVELFKRLKIPGIWDDWKFLSPWKPLEYVTVSDSPVVPSSSSVFRLSSGNIQAVKKASNRNIARKQAIIAYIDSEELKIVNINLDELDFETGGYAESMKGYIPNFDIRKIGNQVIYARKNQLAEDTQKLSQKLLGIAKDAKNLDSVYALSILFVNNILPVEFAKNLSEEFIALEDIKIDIVAIYEGMDLYSMSEYCLVYSKLLKVLLACLSVNNLPVAIQLKVEISVLAYFYCSNIGRIGGDKTIYDLIYLSNFLFKSVFKYDLLKDLYRVGLDRSKLFV